MTEPDSPAVRGSGHLDSVSSGHVLANRVGGAVVMCLGLGIAVEGLSYGMVRDGEPGAGFFPVVLGGLLALLGASLLLVARGEAHRRGDESALPDRAGVVALVVTAVAVFGFLVLLEPLGYVGTMTLFLVAVLRTVTRLRTWAVLAIAVLFTVGTFYAFDAGLGVPLPLSHLVPLAVLGF